MATERLLLREWRDSDIEVEAAASADPEVMRYLDVGARTREQVAEAHRRRMAVGQRVPGLGFWVGFASKEFVGWWILQPPDGPGQPQTPGEADLGYRLLRRWWRQGLASEAGRELLRYGFEELRLGRIFAQTLAVNQPSRAVMTSLGMSFVRSFPTDMPTRIAGAEQGEVEYALTAAEWRARQAASSAPTAAPRRRPEPPRGPG
ncbi:MAG: GNAT family N-acetyltransferase [Candidatus Dormibacteraeota bacterium]|nr:GNAT family N-acetyltransferase [Candidatus Dormibacteraeota bacterium]